MKITRLLALLILAGSIPGVGSAATWRWTGLDPASSAWSRPQNWDLLSAPANDGTATVVFGDLAASARHDPIADQPWDIGSLEIAGDDPYTISGARLSLHAGVTLQSTAAVGIQHQLANDVLLLGDNVWANHSPGALVAMGDIDLGSHRLALAGDGFNTMTVAGDISGTGALVKQGFGGTVWLAGHNTYSGGTTLLFGRLMAQGNHAIPPGAIQIQNGILDLGSTGNIIGPGPVALDGIVLSGGQGKSPVIMGSPIIISALGDWIVYDAAEGMGEVGIGGTIDLDTPDGTRVVRVGDSFATTEEVTVLAAIVNPSSVSGSAPALRKVGQGNVLIAGINTFERALQIEGGNIFLQRAEGIGATGPDNPTIVLAGGALMLASGFTVTNETLRLNGTGQDGRGALQAPFLTNGWAGPVVLESDVTIRTEMSPGLAISGTVSGPGGLTKSGSGVLTLGAANTYQGATLVAGGVLRADPFAGNAIPAAVTVAAGAMLAGDGSVGGTALVQASATIDPAAGGATTSSLAVGAVVFASGSTFRAALVSNGQTARLDAAGSAQFAGRLEAYFPSATTPASGDAYTLVDYATHAGQFTEHSLPVLGTGLQWALDYTPSSLIARVVGATDVAGGSTARTALMAPAPNPFRSSTRIRAELAQAAWARIDIVDVGGRLVNRLLDVRRGPGSFEVEWAGHTTSGARASEGLYFVRLWVDGREAALARRIVLVR